MAGAAQHALGLVFIELHLYKDAYRHLRRALVTWQKIENCYQQAELVYALGYWHHCQGQLSQAQALYRDALALSLSIVASPLLTDLKRRLQEDLDQLANDLGDHAANP
jgi:tetratricopeptide (TPR) repeat protein